MNHLRTALSLTLVFVFLTGMAFPLVVTLLSQGIFPFEANGSLLRRSNGSLLGSSLIGQSFNEPRYFHPRPSAAGYGYDATSSSGTNLGPTSSKLIVGVTDDPTTKDIDESFSGIHSLVASYRKENGLDATARVPADAVTRSASGLDPQISPANALLQAKRVAAARGLSLEQVNHLINDSTEERWLGIFGEPRVNVLLLNLKLDSLRSFEQ